MLQAEHVTRSLNEHGFDIVHEFLESNNTYRLNTLAVHHGVGQGVSIQAFSLGEGDHSRRDWLAGSGNKVYYGR